MKEREQFESWWERVHNNGKPPRFGWQHWRSGDGYLVDDDETEFQWRWEAWQASREALKAEQGYPERLPCSVLLEPGLRFGKGVKTQLVLDALQRRATYYAEREAMTPEQRAEQDEAIRSILNLGPIDTTSHQYEALSKGDSK